MISEFIQHLSQVLEANKDTAEIEIIIRVSKNSGQKSEIKVPSVQQIEIKGESKTAPADEHAFHEVISPMIGTFYSAPAPGQAPFVTVGQEVAEGSVLCIIEAMKLMNEIKAEKSVKISKILVNDKQPVDCSTVLFHIE